MCFIGIIRDSIENDECIKLRNEQALLSPAFLKFAHQQHSTIQQQNQTHKRQQNKTKSLPRVSPGQVRSELWELALRHSVFSKFYHIIRAVSSIPPSQVLLMERECGKPEGNDLVMTRD